jgi:hypothetical protein
VLPLQNLEVPLLFEGEFFQNRLDLGRNLLLGSFQIEHVGGDFRIDAGGESFQGFLAYGRHELILWFSSVSGAGFRLARGVKLLI